VWGFVALTPGAPYDVFPPNCETDQSIQGADGLRRIGYPDGTMVDRTGLTGTYDLLLEYTPGESDRLNPTLTPNRECSAAELQGTTLLTAIREQLGLKLVRSRDAIRTLAVDQVVRPSNN